MTELTIAQFTASLSQRLTPNSPRIARALGFKGGGNTEHWMLVDYLLSFTDPELAALDYYREYPVIVPGAKKAATYYIDLAFNTQTLNPNSPPILSEWKCKRNQNELVQGFFQDANKFTPVLQTYENAPVKPYPFWVGVAQLMDPKNLFFSIQAIPLANGLGLFLTTEQTWQYFNLLQYTAYASDPSIPEQAVAAGTLAASGQRP